MENPAQNQYYADVHLATSPFRWIASIFQAIAVLIVLICIGVGYPLYLAFNNLPVTPAALVGSGLTILAVVTLFYAPIYTSVGGVIFGILFALAVGHYNTFMLENFSHGWGFALLIFGFLSFGILQRYLRRRYKNRNVVLDNRPFAAILWAKDRPVIARQLGAMTSAEFAEHRRLYGDDYLRWPLN